MITLEKRSLTIGFVGGMLVMLVIWMMAVNVFGDGSASSDAASTDSGAISATADEASPTTVVDQTPDTELLSDEPTVRYSDLPTIRPADLPNEALDTLVLIGDGGPYPFRQDDGIFQNREGFLPDEPQGHYREYTVVTPGEDDRGARRIVSGADGELYYTSDHYASFSEIVVEGG